MTDQLRLEGYTGLRLGKHDFSWILRGRAEGYCGRPSLATREFGRAVLNVLADDIVEAMESVFVRGTQPTAYKSAAYWFNWLKRVGFSAMFIIFALFAWQWLQ